MRRVQRPRHLLACITCSFAPFLNLPPIPKAPAPPFAGGTRAGGFLKSHLSLHGCAPLSPHHRQCLGLGARWRAHTQHAEGTVQNLERPTGQTRRVQFLVLRGPLLLALFTPFPPPAPLHTCVHATGLHRGCMTLVYTKARQLPGPTGPEQGRLLPDLRCATQRHSPGTALGKISLPPGVQGWERGRTWRPRGSTTRAGRWDGGRGQG